MTNTYQVAGLDIGFSTNKPTSGVGVFNHGRLALQRCFGGELACLPIAEAATYQTIAIDGPIVPQGQDDEAPRQVERLFCLGSFQKRCKPGMSHIRGTGRRLRHEAGVAASRLAQSAPTTLNGSGFPLVRNGAIIEAFPNAFLGVCLDDDVYATIPVLKRGKKFDWLYSQWTRLQTIKGFGALTPEEQSYFQSIFDETADHEKRAAIVCVLTALLTARKAFVAVGDDKGGWFFLPPWQTWAAWAKQAITENIEIINKKSDGKLCLVLGDE